MPGATPKYPEFSVIINDYKFECQPCKWNISLYILGVSISTGAALAFLGVVHTVIHLAQAVFDSKNCQLHLDQAKIGSKCILKGVIGMIPIAGNLTLFIKDFIQGFQEIRNAESYNNLHHLECKNNYLLMTDNKIIGKKSKKEMADFIANDNKGNDPSFWEMVEFIQNKA